MPPSPLKWVILLVVLSGCGRTGADVAARDSVTADTAFRAMDHRHGSMVGADPASLAHDFIAVAGGGDVILVRTADDSATVEQILEHLGSVADAFRRGDFAIPGFVHAKPVNGTAVMRELRSSIEYTVSPLPEGGVLRIRSTDPVAQKAIGEFIAFQQREHRTGQ